MHQRRPKVKGRLVTAGWMFYIAGDMMVPWSVLVCVDAICAEGRPHVRPALIEDWMPIAALGIESVRERTPMTPFPASNRLHVW